MSSEANVFVFESGDGKRRALTRDLNGANLPRGDGTTWIPKDVVPLTLAAIRTHVTDWDVAMVELIMHGYHVSYVGGDVVPFPVRRRHDHKP
jgi:hypothetical protein